MKCLGEFAWDQMRLVAYEAHKLGEWVSPRTWRGPQLHARWWYWFARTSANKGRSLQYAKNQYALSRHMRDNPEYYKKRPQNRTCWEWFKANEEETARELRQAQRSEASTKAIPDHTLTARD